MRNNIREYSAKLFKYRSFTPIPFLILMFAFQEITLNSLVIGFLIAGIGEWFRLWGVIYAGSETRTTGTVGGTFLVISGAFAFVRNPLYLGNLLIYLGIGIMSMAIFPYLQIAALLFFYFQYRIIIDEEEIYLKKSFGYNFEKYCSAVPRLIPRITPYKNENIEQPVLNINAGIRSEKRTLQAFGSISLTMLVIYLVAVL